MLARVFPMTSETPEAKADSIREALKLPAKSNVLKLAESEVDRVRTRRAELREQIHAAANAGGASNKAIFSSLTAELEAFERGAARKAFEERTRRREEFSKRAMTETAAAVAEYREEMNRLLDEMEALNSAAVELLAASNANGLESLSTVRASLPLAQVLRTVRQLLNNNGSLF
ncbi:hypothetical protein ACFSOZ_30770 [Mesorhizobium newzealandense]|uniref:Uncharacterized protein n=1 Tax=Mesorhizobium newzealandense TaxID=1300302 RepID=A0ABW4UMB4_9HYPH